MTDINACWKPKSAVLISSFEKLQIYVHVPDDLLFCGYIWIQLIYINLVVRSLDGHFSLLKFQVMQVEASFMLL